MPLKKNASLPNSRGFSLLELILVTALLPVVSFAVYGNLSSGARLWQALSQPTAMEDLNIFYRKSSVDFMNTLKFSEIPFEGTPEQVIFATQITTLPELGGDRGIGRVRYGFDDSQKVIFKEESNVHEIYKEKIPQKKFLLNDVQSFRVSYFYFEVLSNAFQWTDVWETDEDKLPVAVRFHFSRGDSADEQTMTFEIPVGG